MTRYTEDDQPSNDQHNHHLVSDFCLLNPHNHCNKDMSQDCRQSPLKTQLNTPGMCHKTHTMTRYGNHDMEDVPVTKTHLPWIPCHQTILWPEKSMNHLINTVNKLTLAIPWLSCCNNWATSGPICPLKICHPPTYTYGRTDPADR